MIGEKVPFHQPMTTAYSGRFIRFTSFMTSRSRLRLFTGGGSAAAPSQETMEFACKGAPPIPAILGNSQVAPGPGLSFRKEPRSWVGKYPSSSGAGTHYLSNTRANYNPLKLLRVV